jgi:hypothetical protein
MRLGENQLSFESLALHGFQKIINPNLTDYTKTSDRPFRFRRLGYDDAKSWNP